MDKFVLLLHLQTALTSLMKKLREWITAQKYIRGPDADGEEGQVLTTDGRGGKTWTTVEASGAAQEALAEAKKYTNSEVQKVKDEVGGFAYEIGNGLKVVDNALTVDTATDVEEDNTKPITSAAVYTEVGNINAILATI